MAKSPNKRITNLRALAAMTLAPVISGSRSLSTTLDKALDAVEPKERPLMQTLCLGSLRVFPKIDLIARKLLQKPFKSRDNDVYALIVLGIYQMDYLRTPDHAAIGETVEAAKALNKPWASKLINGVLRNYQREKVALQHKLNGSMAFQHAHPQWFIDLVRADWPQDWQAILADNNQQPPITLRANKRHCDQQTLLEALHKAEVGAHLCEHSRDGITLEGAADIPALPGFNEGHFSVQDEAAQLSASLLDIQANQRVLDCCSAPGGKAGHICEQANNIDLTCLESDASRMPRVEQNLARLGHTAKLIVEDANAVDSWWDGVPFDRILLDAPCSATGVIRRHPDIKLLRRPSDLAKLAQLQAQILRSVWRTLAPGGKLLYATCSVLKQENENIVSHFVNEQNDARHIPLDNNQPVTWGVERPFGRQLFPQENGHDGFYYALLEKTRD